MWREHAPEPLLASYTAAKRHIADAPRAHEQVDADWDEARVRAWEQAIHADGQTLLVCAAVHEGAVVAFTELEVGPSPAAAQHDTAVLPAHRKMGIATALKTHLVHHLHTERPDIRSVTATINSENRAMIAVNHRVGYRVVRERLLVEASGPPA
jgi:RimJ/RimL family protein N-acetyltransferase